MTYAIGYIVYGISLNKAPEECCEDTRYISECDLAERRYCGNGESPHFVGVEKGEIDECDDIDFSYFSNIQVSEEDKKAFETARNNLLEQLNEAEIEEEPEFKISDQFKNWLRNTEPTLFITWGSS